MALPVLYMELEQDSFRLEQCLLRQRSLQSQRGYRKGNQGYKYSKFCGINLLDYILLDPPKDWRRKFRLNKGENKTVELISSGHLRGHKLKRRLDKFLGDWYALQLLVISSLGTTWAYGCIWTTMLSNPSLARGSLGNYLFFPPLHCATGH